MVELIGQCTYSDLVESQPLNWVHFTYVAMHYNSDVYPLQDVQYSQACADVSNFSNIMQTIQL